MRCRFCGSQSVKRGTEHKNFSAGKAAAGVALLGPVGAAGGLLGREEEGYRCAECGAFMKTPMDASSEFSINSAIREAENYGKTDLFDFFKSQYPNIKANIKISSAPPAELSPNNTPASLPVHHKSTDSENACAKYFYQNRSWQKNCPIFVDQIVIETSGEQNLLSMTIWNNSLKTLRSAYFSVTVYDDTGDELNQLQCTYQKLSVAPGKTLPKDTAFCLNTNLAYRVEIICDKLSFSDDSVWRSDNTPPIPLPIQTELTTDNFPRLKYLRAFLKKDTKCDAHGSLYLPSPKSDYWLCICGQPAEIGNTCPHCAVTFDTLSHLLSQEHLQKIQIEEIKTIAANRAKATTAAYEEAINADKEELYQSAVALQEGDSESALTQAIEFFERLNDYRDSKEQCSACRNKLKELKEKAEAERLEQERQEQIAREKAQKRAEKAQKRAKKAKKAAAVCAVCAVVGIAAALVVTKIIIPNQNYNNAVALMEAEQYEEAIAAFEAMNGYKDSEEQITACETAILDGKYDNAVALMEAGEYAEALTIFGELGNYKDSREQFTILATTFPNRGTLEAGVDHTAALKNDGTVVAVGYNGYGQCDVEEWSGIVSISVGSYHTVGLKAGGTVVAVGNNGDGRCDVEEWTDIVVISTGDQHTVGLKSDGTVVAVGRNQYGQCDVEVWTDIVAISAGGNHTVGLKADGTVVAVGYNGNGQCDVEKWTDIVAISAGTNHTVGLKADGTVVAVGYNGNGQCSVEKWTGIVAISAGGNYTVGLKSDGTVVAVGRNEYGQCDVSNWTNIQMPQ